MIARRLGQTVVLACLLGALAAANGCAASSSGIGPPGPDSGLGGGDTGGSSSGGVGGTGGSTGGGPSGGSGGSAGQAGAAADAGSDAEDDASDAGDASDDASDASDDATDATDATDAGSGPRIVMSEGTASRIYVLDTSGNVIANFPSPVASPRGVACDRAKNDGFYVMGTSDPNKIYKLSWSGAPLAPVTLSGPLANPATMRGLDYYLNSGGDQLVFIYTNSGGFDVVQAVDLSGQTQLQSSHYKGGFLAGFWGIHVVGPAAGGDVERWTSWNDGSIQRWVASQTQAQVLSPGLGALRGLSRMPNGDFWVVAGGEIDHLDANGVKLGGFAAPSSDPRDVSYTD